MRGGPGRPGRGVLVFLFCAAAPLAARAQSGGWPGALRADLIQNRVTAAYLGAGAVVPMGYYVRLDATIAGGAVLLPSSNAAASLRAELVSRFLLDPFLEYRHGAYLGAGMGWRGDRGARGRLALLTVFGVEGWPRHGLAPSVELGLGGGVRLGVVVRRTRPDAR